MNQGTALDPDFSAARHILKFPFLHIFYNTDKVSAYIQLMCMHQYIHVHVLSIEFVLFPQQAMSSVFEVWKEMYDIFTIHASLVVKGTCMCTCMYMVIGAVELPQLDPSY